MSAAFNCGNCGQMMDGETEKSDFYIELILLKHRAIQPVRVDRLDLCAACVEAMADALEKRRWTSSART